MSKYDQYILFTPVFEEGYITDNRTFAEYTDIERNQVYKEMNLTFAGYTKLRDINFLKTWFISYLIPNNYITAKAAVTELDRINK